MRRIIDWIKQNKLVTLIVIILLFLVAKDYFPGYFFGLAPLRKTYMEPMSEFGAIEDIEYAPGFGEGIGIPPIPSREYAPTEREERLVVEESTMSLVVTNVREISDKIIDHAKSAGGYMVSTSLINPEEAPFATVVVRIPAENFRAALDYFRSLGVKVTSERILGTDVTDEYVDIEARLATLEKTKAKFEEILEMATEVQDILDVQRQLIYIQDQIDNLKGRQKYLEQTAKLSKITVYLSTDEFALPYAPAEAFRPRAIFKLAVRSLVCTLRGVARALIWIGVYAIIWIPVGLIIFFVWRWKKKRFPPST
ncbi:DUF4349 domain-containing protein [Patescibacteria group bacterium]|nr:DUF4349 domain-containing protein [Patescibacteria group bacterium]